MEELIHCYIICGVIIPKKTYTTTSIGLFIGNSDKAIKKKKEMGLVRNANKL